MYFNLKKKVGIVLVSLMLVLSAQTTIPVLAASDGKVNPIGNAPRVELAVMCSRLVGLIK